MSNNEVIGIDQSDDSLKYFALFLDYDFTIFDVAIIESNEKRLWMIKLQPLKEIIYENYVIFLKGKIQDCISMFNNF